MRFRFTALASFLPAATATRVAPFSLGSARAATGPAEPRFPASNNCPMRSPPRKRSRRGRFCILARPVHAFKTDSFARLAGKTGYRRHSWIKRCDFAAIPGKVKPKAKNWPPKRDRRQEDCGKGRLNRTNCLDNTRRMNILVNSPPRPSGRSRDSFMRFSAPAVTICE